MPQTDPGLAQAQAQFVDTMSRLATHPTIYMDDDRGVGYLHATGGAGRLRQHTLIVLEDPSALSTMGSDEQRDVVLDRYLAAGGTVLRVVQNIKIRVTDHGVELVRLGWSPRRLWAAVRRPFAGIDSRLATADELREVCARLAVSRPLVLPSMALPREGTAEGQ